MRKILVVVLIIIVVMTGYTAVSWFKGRNAVKEYCSQVGGGMNLEAAKTLATSLGLRFHSSQPSGEGQQFTALVTGSSTMGRYTCAVVHDGKQVTSASVSFHD
jgi:hypothetical protein